MYTIKEEDFITKLFRIEKAYKQIHLNAFGEQMTENIYYCKKCEHVQIKEDACPECDNKMEKIGFVDYSEDDAK